MEHCLLGALSGARQGQRAPAKHGAFHRSASRQRPRAPTTALHLDMASNSIAFHPRWVRGLAAAALALLLCALPAASAARLMRSNEDDNLKYCRSIEGARVGGAGRGGVARRGRAKC